MIGDTLSASPIGGDSSDSGGSTVVDNTIIGTIPTPHSWLCFGGSVRSSAIALSSLLTFHHESDGATIEGNALQFSSSIRGGGEVRGTAPVYSKIVFDHPIGTFEIHGSTGAIHSLVTATISGLFEIKGIAALKSSTLFGAARALGKIGNIHSRIEFNQPIGLFSIHADPLSFGSMVSFDGRHGFSILGETYPFSSWFSTPGEIVGEYLSFSSLITLHPKLLEETTYAINLQTNAVTQITLGHLQKIVSAHGRVYGLTTDGTLLMLMGNPETSMNASFRLAPSAIGVNHPIRLRDIYLMARDTHAISLSVVQNETVSQPYLGVSNGVSDLCTHKVKPGRGPVLTTTGLQVNNVDGGSLDVASIEILFDTLSRRIR